MVLPQLGAVDVVIGEPEAGVMEVVAALACDLLHGKVARHHLARSGAQRGEIRFAGFGAVVKRGEGLAIDGDVDPVAREADLGGETCRQQKDECGAHFRASIAPAAGSGDNSMCICRFSQSHWRCWRWGSPPRSRCRTCAPKPPPAGRYSTSGTRRNSR